MFLYNRINKKELKQKLAEDSTKRITVSFYRYVIIEKPAELRNQLFEKWANLNILGRIYLANEGINAQMCVPEENWDIFKNDLYADERFKNVPFKSSKENCSRWFGRYKF